MKCIINNLFIFLYYKKHLEYFEYTFYNNERKDTI